MNALPLLLTALTALPPAAAEPAPAGKPALRLANIFGDGMVLQRDRPLRIWGRAAPGAKVTVTLTESRDEALRLAGAEALRRQAPPPPAKPAKKGEEEPDTYRARISYVEENAPPFRTLTAEATADADGQWEATLPATAASFRPKWLLAVSGGQAVAVGDVLVGEVWLCAGQSNMFWSGNRTKWIDSEGLLPPGVRYAHTGRASHYLPRADLAEPVAWKPCTEENLKGVSTIPYLFGKYLHQRLGVPVGILNAASGGAQGIYWCSLEQLRKIDDPAVREIMAIHDRALAEWDNPEHRAKVIAEYEKQYARELAEWKQAAEAAKARGKRPPRQPAHRPPSRPQSPFMAAYLYNGRVAPIGRLALRGVLYLQGEQQVLTWCVSRYRHTFPAVIRSFRSAFGDPNLPFGIITLQGASHTRSDLGEVDMIDRTCVVREIHYRTHLATPQTGFICAADVGLGLHPNYKRPVAERAAWWALRDIYRAVPDNRLSVDRIEYANGRAKVYIVSRRLRRRKNRDGTWSEESIKVPVSFRPWSGNDTRPLSGFMIAGKDRRWYPAKVRPLTDEKALEVWSDLVDEPVALRYGWGGYTTANLGPWEDPLPPFRTDDWPLPESYSYKPGLKEKYRSAWYEALGTHYEQMLDRVIRQGRIDAAVAEMKLHGRAAGILREKARRIEEILDEISPDFYRDDRLRQPDQRDWKLLRQEEPRLARAAKLADELAAVLADNPGLVQAVERLRGALADFRKAAEQLQPAEASRAPGEGR